MTINANDLRRAIGARRETNDDRPATREDRVAWVEALRELDSEELGILQCEIAQARQLLERKRKLKVGAVGYTTSDGIDVAVATPEAEEELS